MANNYTMFSELIKEVTPEEKEWLDKVLSLDCDEEDLEQSLMKTLGVEELVQVDVDMWPGFEWETSGPHKGELWIYGEEWVHEGNLIAFMQAFIEKFRPDFIFTATFSEWCDKPRISEFGGSWLAISADLVAGGNTWDAAKEQAERMNEEGKL